MANTAENLARKYGITREAADEFAYRSHMLAAKAREDCRFSEEIVPVEGGAPPPAPPPQKTTPLPDKEEDNPPPTTPPALARLPTPLRDKSTGATPDRSRVHAGAARAG